MLFSKRSLCLVVLAGFIVSVSTVIHACPTPEFSRKVNQCRFNKIDYSDGIIISKKLISGVQQNRKLMVADLVAYPLRVNQTNSHSYLVKSREQFVKKYNAIFTPQVVHRIVTSDPNDIFCSYRGATIGDGVVWYQGKGYLKIVAINQ